MAVAFSKFIQKAFAMITYRNISRNSGITAYQTGPDYIEIKFLDGSVYKYTYKSAGKTIIETMKKLANEGKGLSTYISQTVKDKFEH